MIWHIFENVLGIGMMVALFFAVYKIYFASHHDKFGIARSS